MSEQIAVTCPFCGAHGSIDTLNRANGIPGSYRVQCSGCGAVTKWCDTEEAAWAAWNIRVQNNREEKQMGEHTIQVSLSEEEYAEFRRLIDNSVFDEVKWLRRTIVYGIKVAKRNLDRKYSLNIPAVDAVG
jgi:Lar family restriction alleviation protein